MDHCASVLLAFPPSSPLTNNDQYHRAAVAHVQRVDKMIKDNAASFNGYANQLLEHVDPAKNSISYIALLHTILVHGNPTPPHDDLLVAITTFLMTFDSRQIRYVGGPFSIVLGAVREGVLFPASVAVELVATALLRLDPTGTMLTSHHIPLVTLAYETDNIEPVLPVIEKTIVFYPGMKGPPETRYPCDMQLPPPAYITPESFLTTRLNVTNVLQYDLFCGMCFIQRRAWRQAFDALERVVSYPTREGGCSKIMENAHNKWLLVGLLLNGKTPTLPATTGQAAQKSYATHGKPYAAIGEAFGQATAETLKTEFESVGSQFWADDGNLALVRLVLTHYQRWQIKKLRDVYTKISLEQMRTRTQSAEATGPLKTEAEFEALVESMISEGMLNGVIERPADGKPAYLTFLSPNEELSEGEFAAKMLSTAQRIRDLGPVVKATNERLATSKDYLRHLVKEQKKDKQGQTDPFTRFEQTVDDEDLMMDVVSGN
ncbi:hypothetical protein B0T22DRAFT_225883 [Podospora appendiculata]|uniref:COP9 signalosome complex subunit 3 n=1 Tax=Podospora appendiculata TaxID=314037 RepID=A0AAE1CAJ9_9PEZI|nr:hypothetical protein B0T22DRAFT_225883 [Podospora appendiculata]